MDSELLDDDGRFMGTRTTVYHLMPFFLDPRATEAEIARINDVTPEQVAAARAFVLHHPDEVLAQHLRIEERIAIGNPPEVNAKLREGLEVFQRFREWIKLKEELDQREMADVEGSEEIPTDYLSFRRWVAELKAPVAARS